MDTLTKNDLDLLIELTDHAKRNYRTADYPSERMRQEQLERVDAVARKLRARLTRLKT